ncbi:hypothetical protein Tco_0354797 [Tanacetum coccineum]
MEYEAWMNKQYVHPTKSEGTDFRYLSSKDVGMEYPYYFDGAKTDLYYELPLLLPCFQPVQPRAKFGYESPYEDIGGDTDSIAEYEFEEGEHELNKHTDQTINEWFKPIIKKYRMMHQKNWECAKTMARIQKVLVCAHAIRIFIQLEIREPTGSHTYT